MHHRFISLAIGGASLSVVLVACGGGGGDPTTAGTGPMAEPPPTNVTAWRSNPAAHDLRDHWNDPETITERWSLEPVEDPDARKRTVATLLASADAEPRRTGTRLRNVSIDDLTILGERGGITYGQWKGGPAGTLHIEFDFRNAPEINPYWRAALERAGKLWSHRLAADTDGFHGQIGDYAIDTDGLLIAVYTKSGHTSTGRPVAFRVKGEDSGDFEPYFGEIRIGRDRMAHSERTRDNLMSHSIMHEVGHVLGFSDFQDAPHWEGHLDRQSNTWHGANALAANGGQPVPMQWLDSDRRPVPPHTEDATRDPSHTGVCTSIMAYCSYPGRSPNPPVRPSELDLAFLADMGYAIVDKATGSEPELYGYGAWARYSAWGAGVERLLVDNQYDPSDRLRAGADAFGTAPGGPLASSTVEGDVTWTGSLIGVDLGSAALPPVAGDAGVRVDLATLDGRATFERLTVHADGASRPFRAPSLEYAIAVTNNAFSDQEGRVQGGFFGPAHEEMAGVLHDPSTAVNLLAGFGGTR